ncbi:MAG: hypothetical protein ABR573_01605 [Candidatus Dormibacteria bacterium]
MRPDSQIATRSNWLGSTPYRAAAPRMMSAIDPVATTGRGTTTTGFGGGGGGGASTTGAGAAGAAGGGGGGSAGMPLMLSG